jgi:hypothetical protein
MQTQGQSEWRMQAFDYNNHSGNHSSPEVYNTVVVPASLKIMLPPRLNFGQTKFKLQSQACTNLEGG